MTKFLGIDAGLRKTGWAIVTKSRTQIKYIASGVIKTKGNEVESLLNIFEGITTVILDYKPDFAAIENTYVNENPLSSLKLAQARSASLIACAKNQLIPTEYQASSIKKVVTGKGNADKSQVQRMINLQLGQIITETHDESDAIAIALCDALFKKSI